ncbi:chloride channel protein [Streptomyces sp. SAJ15]|uniref:chloride channel protein n=1 Tax=Streptomyces sp. SAJ15 TaxID=2011095 RepID=UPI001184CF15|nr:chloride channel protein [Streptomyces sp. SAJ15]TVL89624.1 chloride channel core [Streptomyces sp. SAJ15]
MTQHPSGPPGAAAQPDETERLRAVLHSPGYLRTVGFCALIGVPVSLAAFWLLVGLHQLTRLLWESWPHTLGWQVPPWWWPLPLALVPGVVVGVVATRLPGGGGHIPAAGFQSGGASAAALPGVLLAAAACLPFGAVLGPEAPLIAFGGGLALLLAGPARMGGHPDLAALLSAAGSAAAIAAIFGNALVAAVLLIEVAGVAGPRLVLVMLPALACSGVGALVFTGFGRWTGLGTGGLDIGLPAPPPLDAGDVVGAVVIGLLLGPVLRLVTAAGRRTAAFVAVRPLPRTLLCALAAAGCAALYALLTGRSPAEAALSGQSALAGLAADPAGWPDGALVAVLLFKSAGYALCLGSLRGGPIFPVAFLGGALGALLAPLPGLGLVPGMAAGMAAGVVAVLRLPVSSAVLVVLLVGSIEIIPVVIIALVVSLLASQLPPGTVLRRLFRRGRGGPQGGRHGGRRGATPPAPR